MKKEVLLLIFFICIISVFAIEQDTTGSWLNRTYSVGNYPQIDVVSLKYEPYPVEPGQYFTLWLKIKNLGNVDAANVEVEVVEKEPFSIGENIQTIGSLPSRQEYLLKFENIKVSEDAVEGDNVLEIKSTAGGGYSNEYKHDKIKIRIQSVSPVLDISVKSDPEMVPQGGTAKITLTLKNTAKSLLKDITVKLNLPDELVSVNSVAEKKIDRIKSGSEKDLEFSVLAMADASAKAYKVGMNITYYDEIGNRYSKMNDMGLLVGSNPEFAIYVGDNEILKRGEVGEISFDVYNIGPSDIKFVNIELIPTKEYDVVSVPKLYLGNIDSDDYESGEFKVYAGSCFMCENEIKFKIYLEYRDSYNNEKQEIVYVPLKLYSGKQIKSFGLRSVGNGYSPIIYLIIIIFIYLAYKGYRKEKNLPKALKYSALKMLTYVVRFVRKLKWRYIKRVPRKLKQFFRSLR